MARRRFMVKGFGSGRAALTGEQAHHLARVLRAQPGQLYELSDGREVWLGRVAGVSRDRIEFELVEKLTQASAEPRLVLLAALIKFDRWEWLLEKGTELGVTEVVPVAAARTLKRLAQAAPARSARWQKILLNAAQQARRAAPPRLLPVSRATEAFAQVDAQVKILLSEARESPLLRMVLREFPAPLQSVALAIGPEGGWTEEEREAAHAAGFREASLGGNILRAETAVLAALAVLSHELASS
ncbi:MAG: 16S rRNA (uracil(1498)-N(3))-methyltransferase [Acidobacteria bacterium]|nr:16S rRNA (uracil(1498)-N(3))-methyltransferase [Acidobacteriota bacterium]